MFSFWFSSLSVYFYTLTTNTNTLWPLAKGEVLQLSVPMKGMQVSIYSTKSQVQKGYEFEILDETSLQYATISSQEIQKRPIQFITFCSTSGKIIVTATEDVELFLQLSIQLQTQISVPAQFLFHIFQMIHHRITQHLKTALILFLNPFQRLDHFSFSYFSLR